MSPSLNHILSSFLGFRRTMAFGAKLTLIGMLSRILQRRTPSIWWDLPIPEQRLIQVTFPSLPWQGQGGQVEGYPCVSALMSSSFPLSKREVVIITHDNYCEGQVPDNCLAISVIVVRSPSEGIPHPPLSGQQVTGHQSSVSQDGHLSPRNASLKAYCMSAVGSWDAQGACTQPWMIPPRRAEAGIFIVNFHRAWVESCFWGCIMTLVLLKEPAGLCGQREISGEGPRGAWELPAKLQVTSRVGWGALGGQGPYMMLQGREKARGSRTERTRCVTADTLRWDMPGSPWGLRDASTPDLCVWALACRVLIKPLLWRFE